MFEKLRKFWDTCFCNSKCMSENETHINIYQTNLRNMTLKRNDMKRISKILDKYILKDEDISQTSETTQI